MKKIVLMVIMLLVVVMSCLPSDSPTTSEPTSTSGSTTSIKSNKIVINTSNSDDTSTLTSAISNYDEIIIDIPLKINQIATLNNVSNKIITFTNRGKLVRNIRPNQVTYQVLKIVDSKNITINNLQIEGPNIEMCGFLYVPPVGQGNPRVIRAGYNAAYESQHGLELRGVDGITVNGGKVYGMSGDGVYIDKSSTKASANITINDLNTDCTGRSSISNVGSQNVTVNRGRYTNSGLWIFNIEPYNTNYVYDYTINQPSVGYSNFEWLFAAGPYYSCLVRNVKIVAPIFLEPVRPPTIKACIGDQIKIS